MAKTPKIEKPEDVEVEPDAWDRFRSTVKSAARKPPARTKPKRQRNKDAPKK